MLRYLVRRTLFMVLVLFIVSLLTFLIFVKLPAGDPARRAAGKSSTPEQIANARRAFGLDRPLCVQYARFAKGLVPWPGLFLSEDVYYSYGNFVPVKEEIARRLPVTATLAVGGAAIWLALGIPLGVLAGIKRRSAASRMAMLLAIVGVSMPVFWLGQLLLYVFWFKLGMGAAERTRGRAERAGGRAHRLVHPAVDHGRGRIRRDLCAHDPVEHDRDDERGLHPDGAREGASRNAP